MFRMVFVVIFKIYNECYLARNSMVSSLPMAICLVFWLNTIKGKSLVVWIMEETCLPDQLSFISSIVSPVL